MRFPGQKETVENSIDLAEVAIVLEPFYELDAQSTKLIGRFNIVTPDLYRGIAHDGQTTGRGQAVGYGQMQGCQENDRQQSRSANVNRMDTGCQDLGGSQPTPIAHKGQITEDFERKAGWRRLLQWNAQLLQRAQTGFYGRLQLMLGIVTLNPDHVS